MTRPAPTDVRKIAVVGTGLIGASWTAYYLSRGLEVAATDPAPGARDQLAAFIARVWPQLEELGLAANADPDRWTFAKDVESVVGDADFVQENAPEREEIKRDVFARIDAGAASDVVIASSASGMLITPLQVRLKHPERCILSHPFNPPHLVPLVELSGGEQTDSTALDWSMAFYEAVGKVPIRLAREMPGHIASRMQGAMWREAVYLVEQGIASVEDIDKALAYGPGLRMAAFGPHMTFHLAGGSGGLQHFIDHIGESQVRRWKTLGNPELTPAVREKLVKGVAAECKGRSIADLEAERDACLIAVIKALGSARAAAR
ncbi:MAG TPA: 3-hydroxyacyl-CoA dehydrogenase NAD-binding domain-containing protein [Rhodospirillales bacterium]|nr:3-hydroxyacyl-CoA dehydrogenase NAD-binding domain-containing protein [Rhodospirillales bacterium]